VRLGLVCSLWPVTANNFDDDDGWDGVDDHNMTPIRNVRCNYSFHKTREEEVCMMCSKGEEKKEVGNVIHEIQ